MNELLVFLLVFGLIAAAYLLPDKLQIPTRLGKDTLSHKFWREALGTDLVGCEKGDHQNEMAQLRQRIQVLEAIVTDSKVDLKRQIDNL